MEENQALNLFLQQIPETGEVTHEVVDNALQVTADGRKARPFLHKFRRSGKIVARINRETGELMLSRPVGGA